MKDKLLKFISLLSGYLGKFGVGLLVVLWLLVQLRLYQQYSVKLVPDSTFRYIPYATEVAANGITAGAHDNRYLGYIFFLGFFLKTGLSLPAAILAQVAFSGFAAICLYKIAKALTHSSSIAAFAATLLFILWKDVQYLNYYILTESLFTSFILITLYFTIRATSFMSLLPALLAAGFTTVLRPNGFIVLVGVLLYFLYTQRDLLRKYKLTSAVALAGALLLAFLALDKYLLVTFKVVETYASGSVIYASNMFALNPQEYQVTTPPVNQPPVLRITTFIGEHPMYFLKLLLLKLGLFVAYAKPYYSLFHQLLIILVIYPLYLFSVPFFRSKGWGDTKAFILTVILLQTAIVAFTVEDWDSRFVIPLIPLVMITGVAGARIVVKNILNR
ncbi:glycosyltransferase family 39 protein [Pontibacter cellulosilyticus]|uniref:Glycosyltransferase family 39 protein n=1 Tax=Pontibacter cellulosilyticus TaxID=1720253 RepID=A0A923NBD5_9BACT|nr:glycosyltransferase family 39 protein [Pontibacter cellulosilyticus]MBC5994801.1 glycosyltransferase family 39 protein [Pontibacter cellulosilyticus]